MNPLRLLLLLPAILLSGFGLPVSSFAQSASPYTIPFQGRLTNQQGVPYTSGQYTIVFNIYSQAVGGATKWTERHEKVGVTNGMISVFLGSISALPVTEGNPPQPFFGAARYLGITVDADDNAATADPEMVPRQMIVPAFHAKNADKMSSPFGFRDWTAVFGNNDPATNNILLSKIPTLTPDKLPNNIPGSKLAPTAALENFNASGYGAIGSGGMIFSATANNPALISAGYQQVGVGQVGDGWRNGAPCPFAAQGACHVWTGSKMLIWGNAPDGASYDPAADSWSILPAAGAPSSRLIGYDALPANIWTGSEFILWGGGAAPPNYALGDGAAFNPANPASPWRTITTVGAPAPRRAATYAWSPEHQLMFVGGGVDSSGQVPGAYALAPAAGANGAWTTLPTLNSPFPVDGSTSVWTGQSWFVWGGRAGSNRNTGALYTPGPGGSSGSWQAIPVTANTPSARYIAHAVWTGSEVIVWGGEGSAGQLGDGSLYNPTTQSWRKMASSGAPAGRIGASFAWTGSEFIIWGGEQGGVTRNDGARYNPATDTWMPISPVSSVTRSVAQSIWTGSELVITGGYSSSGTTDQLRQTIIYYPPRTLYFYQRP